MSIVFLGWGSLIRKPGDLPIVGPWNHDGPELPIEFLRKGDSDDESLKGKEAVTLVIEPSLTRRVTTLWIAAGVQTLDEAVASLKARERTATRLIGAWSPASRITDDVTDTIGRWAAERELTGVVWTALPPRWGENGIVPRIDDVLEYLRTQEPNSTAENYIRTAPRQTRTDYRDRIEQDLGWTPID